MTARILPLNRPARLHCSGCGIGVDAACDCGKPYIPAGEAARAAVIATPEQSNRAIAARLGVDEGTVRNARRATAENSAVEAPRVGRDGRVRNLPRPRLVPEPEPEDDETPPDSSFHGAFHVRATQAQNDAFYNGPLRRGWAREFAKRSREVAQAWLDLAERLEEGTS